MDKTLSKWAAENNVKYHSAWKNFSEGKIDNAYKDSDGKIFVKSEKSVTQVVNTAFASPKETNLIEESYASMRKNAAGTINPIERFKNIDDGLTPFVFRNYGANSYLTIRDAVILVGKCYYNFSVFRGVIDLMSELAAAPIHFKGGNAKSREFFKAYFKKIKLSSLIKQYFREYFRSGNVFIEKNLGRLKSSDAIKITKLYSALASDKISIPVRYTILNPADVLVGGASSFFNVTYFKELTDYELSRLREPRTPEDKLVFDSLPPEIKKLIKSKAGVVIVPLNMDKMYYIGYKRQDYEPLAVPMGWSVLDDLSRKEEMKRMDAAICRTMQQVVLLITVGYESKNGEYKVSQKQIEEIQKLFTNQSVGRVLVSDFTTKAQFIIPDIGDILEPKKYEVLERDISVGLNNILGSSSEKFANKSITVEIFVERLREARQVFLEEFLQNEIEKIALEMNMKSYPEAFFQDIDMRDEIQMARIYSQLAQLGILTPAETLKAIETGILPSEEDSFESQEKYKQAKENDLFQPIAPKQEEEIPAAGGRPAGSKKPQSTKNVKPIGTSKAQFSLKKVTDNFINLNKLTDSIAKELKLKHNLKKLNSNQLEVCEGIANTIVKNEIPENWQDKTIIAHYIENPENKNQEINKAILEIAEEHQTEESLAAILYHSKI